MLADIGHLQEIIKSLCLHAADPHRLPPASEQVILDTKGSDSSTWSFQVITERRKKSLKKKNCLRTTPELCYADGVLYLH